MPTPTRASSTDAVAQPARWAVETTMYRALAVLRAVVLVNAVVLNALKWDELARPGLAAVVLAAMAAWTAWAAWAYDAPARRRPWLLVADLVLAVGAIVATLAVQSPAQLRDITTLPSFWVMAAVLAWGIRWDHLGGFVAATVVSAADVWIRGDLNQTNVGNLFLLMIGGPLVGYCAHLLKEMADARDQAERAAAAAAERARLARVVHDGVLQVLALVQRRGRELGGEAAELGRLAGEQEVTLRALVQGDSAASRTPATPGAPADLAVAAGSLQSGSVTVSVPGGPVELPAHVVDELLAVVRASLDNTARHVGADAPAWVLVEDLGDTVVVTVRDEGDGIPAGRLEQARAEGRLGVSESICGRMADLGGRAELFTGPGRGTEWELTVRRT